MLDMIKEILTQPAVITAVIGVFATLIARVLTAKPEWKKYMGFIIEAIKFAEKAIPDGIPNKGARRLDMALKMVLAELGNTKVNPSKKLEKEIRMNIPVVHDMLESNGTLRK